MSDTNGPERIDAYIADIDDWRGPLLASLRKTILSVDPGIVEAFKWMGSPVWELDGMLLVGNAHKKKVKLTFAYGASLPDPAGLFNGNDTGQTRRSIDLFEGDSIDRDALRDLVRAAIVHNRTRLKKNASR